MQECELEQRFIVEKRSASARCLNDKSDRFHHVSRLLEKDSSQLLAQSLVAVSSSTSTMQDPNSRCTAAQAARSGLVCEVGVSTCSCLEAARHPWLSGRAKRSIPQPIPLQAGIVQESCNL